MSWFISRRRHEAELAAVRAVADRLRTERDKALRLQATAEFNRGQALTQAASVDAANRLLHRYNDEAHQYIRDLTKVGPARSAALQRRVDRLRLVGERVLAAWAAEKKRADRLQEQYDDACGLNDPRVLDGERWQQTRQDGGRKGVSA
ncbi:hypothetical protein [Streptomyces sp. NPDC002132]|uniref:hypothetical protein n=1 Tax=unclassified Streptomyces TaxID=2593676 RepID=UPI0033228ECB